MRSRACFATFASLFLLSCEAKVEGAAPEPVVTAPKAEKAEKAEEGSRPDPIVVQVSRPVMMQAAVSAPLDLEEASAVVAQYQAQEQIQQIQDHGERLQKVSQHSDSIRTEVAEIRWHLILKRFDQLEEQAKKYKWSEDKGPKKGDPFWEDYKEWLYLTEYLEEMLRYGPPDLTRPPNQPIEIPEKPQSDEAVGVAPPPPQPKPTRPKGGKKGYRPRWMKK